MRLLGKKAFLFTLGCKVNSYETDCLMGELRDKGVAVVETPEEADIVIVNTCAVTKTAFQKSKQHVRKFRRLNEKAVLAGLGCGIKELERQKETLPLDILIENYKKEETVRALEDFEREPIALKDEPGKTPYSEFCSPPLTKNVRAYLKVQDGCHNFCAYCLIPYLRGPSRSRRKEDVLSEAQSLIKRGYRELIVSGIHVGYYGQDLYSDYRLADLLKDLLDLSGSKARIRLSSIEETEVTDELIALFDSYPSFCRHLHIPLQSGAEQVLRRMGRKYDTASFLKKLEAIRLKVPDISITTDVIAGFPGETEEEHRETLSFIEKARFSALHVFPYSPREGTRAFLLNDLDGATKKRRAKEIQELGNRLKGEYESRFVGKETEILFEEFDEERQRAVGHSSNYLKVAIPSPSPLDGKFGVVVLEKGHLGLVDE